jgi:xylose isomerase
MNRGDEMLGWDTDQFPNNLCSWRWRSISIISCGGLGTGGLNFDAKVRRQSLDPVDQLEGHIGGIDTLARAFLSAAALHESGDLERARRARYEGWDSELGLRIQAGTGLDALSQDVLSRGYEPKPRSGRQERLENLVNRYA